MSSSVHAIIVISIHAAREGGDRYGARLQPLFAISIHAAREGGDRAEDTEEVESRDFNPRRP